MELLSVIIAGLLLLATLPLPYGFYTLLRILVTIAAGIKVATNADDEKPHLEYSTAAQRVITLRFQVLYLILHQQRKKRCVEC